MKGELDASVVAARLESLRALDMLETVEDAERRLVAERPLVEEPFAVAVARRLAELRALSDLASYLHRRR